MPESFIIFLTESTALIKEVASPTVCLVDFLRLLGLSFLLFQ